MVKMICIGCPRGCHLEVDENNDYKVTGNNCETGAEYGKNELTNPTRILTSTVSISNAIHNRLPVKSNAPLPKAMILQAVKALKDIKVKAPVSVGQVIVSNVANTGIDIVASRDM